jgi:PAS domain S-box-containing protein
MFQHDYQHLVNDSTLARTMDGVINFWNDSAENLYGWRKEEAVGRISHNLLQTQFPKPLEEIESELLRMGQWKGRLVHTTRGGDRVVVESRWVLNRERESGAVVESNEPVTDYEPAGIDRHSGETETEVRAATSNAKKIADVVVQKIADTVLTTIGFGCILVSLYFIYYYGWKAERHFNNPAIGIVVYWVAPVILAAILFAVLKWGGKSKINAALFCLSSTSAIYGGELLLSALRSTDLPPPPNVGGQMKGQSEKDALLKLAKQFDVRFDTRSKLEFIRDLRRQGIHPVPAVHPSHLLIEQKDGTRRSRIDIRGRESLPLGGISNKVTVLCNETGEYITYHSDEHGFRNAPGIWKLHRVDIAAVGDSFTHGACVASDRTFAGLIQKRYPATLNLGMSGSGPLTELAALKEYLPPFAPKVVLWFYYEENDLPDVRSETKSPLLMRYMEKGFSQGLLARQDDIDEALETYIKEQEVLEDRKEEAAKREEPLRRNSQTGMTEKVKNIIKLSNLRTRLGLVYGNGTVITDEHAWRTVGTAELDMLRNVLSQAKASVEGWGGTLYFVYLPEWYRYGEPRLADKNRESVLKLVETLKIRTVDLHPVFQAQKDPLSLFPLRRFLHYNEKGHRLVAEEILKVVSAEFK